MMINLVNKEHVKNLTGLTDAQAKNVIRIAKKKLVNEGFDWYSNKRVGSVPLKVVEDILGLNLKE